MARLVHISDFHCESSMTQGRVVDALAKDLRNLHDSKEIDVIVLSGDLAAKGKTENEDIENIAAELISKIKEAVGHDVSWVVVPGNHDVNLKKRSALYAPIFSDVTSPEKANELIRGCLGDPVAPLWTHLDGFRALAKVIDQDAFADNPFFYTKRLRVGLKTIGFACVNSAWLSAGGGQKDYGQLYVGEYALDLARKELEDVDLRIAVMHHPLDWLAPEEKSRIQRYLTLNFNGFMCGHKHDNNADSMYSNVGSLFTSNTGCIYHTEDYFNGYSVIDVDFDSGVWKVGAREYYYQRAAFDIAPRFSADGCWESPIRLNGIRDQIAISGAVIRAVHERANARLLSYASDIAPKSVGALFVEPPLSMVSEKELVAKTKGGTVPKDAYVSLSALGVRPEALMFVGKKESGKSLLLHHIAVNEFQVFCSVAKLGVVLDVHAIKKMTEAGLLEQAVEFCGGEILRKTIIQLLDSGFVVVCLDNVRLNEQACVDLIRGFIKRFPKNRYVFAVAEEAVDGLARTEVPDLGVALQKVYVHSFRMRHTTELVKKWFGSSDLEIRKRVQDVNLLLDKLRVPRTPFLVSVLSWVIEQRPNSNVINRASAIEILIEGLLGKFSEIKSRKGIDSNIQQHFLTELAVRLNELDYDWLPVLDFHQFVLEYFRSKGLTVSVDGFWHDLVEKGILYVTETRVGFKFDCFRAFFLARKFAEDASLWKIALDPFQVAKYSSELDLFTGLHRDRVDVLESARDHCFSSYKQLGIEFPLDEIDRIGDEHLTLDSRALQRVEDKFVNPKNDMALVEHESPDIVSIDHEESRRRRKAPDLGEVGRYLESLRVFSMILRNSELVSDLGLKRNSLNLALEQWANATIAIILELLDRARSGEIAADLKEIVGERVSPVEAAGIIRTTLTQMMLAVMCESLASPKLEVLVREKADDPRTLIRVLAVALALEVGDDDSVKFVRGLLRDFKKNKFVLEILFLKVLTVYMIGGQDTRLRDLLGDILIQLRGGSLQDVANVKARFLGAIDKDFLLKGGENR